MENTDILTNGAESAEAVVNGSEKQSVSGEDLFSAYQEGTSFEELQRMFAEKEETDPSKEQAADAAGAEEEFLENEAPETDQGQELPPENAAEESKVPYRVYETKEDFQKHFDHEWNKRYATMKSKMSEQEARIEETKSLLAEVLGVPAERAMEELEKRRYAQEAEQNGYDNPEQYAALKRAEKEIAGYKRAEEARAAERSVAEIRRQGDALSQQFSAFDLDRAMENEMFRQTVFSLHRAGAQDAVERAFKAVFFEDFIKQSEPKKEMVIRPKEGGVSPKTRGAVKSVNVASYSPAQIRALEKDIISGKKIDFS